MVHASITDLVTLKATPRFPGDHRILWYLDLFVVKVDVARELCLDGGDDQLSSSSHSTSGSTSSSLSNRNCNKSSAFDFETSGHVIWAHALWMVPHVIDLVVRLPRPLFHVLNISVWNSWTGEFLIHLSI
jgi:hypothetical protein